MYAAPSHPHFITADKGNKTAVILPIEAYAELLEDLSGLATVAERRSEETISHKELLDSLKADSLI
jgi:hypothetical protein